MAMGFRLSSAATALAAIGLAAMFWMSPEPVRAQETTSRDQVSVSQSDCAKLPGGNAPVNRIARIEGGISVRNLELTYFGKPLYELTALDYRTLEALWPLCETFDASISATILDKMRMLIDDAKSAREQSLDWIRRTEQELDRMPPGSDSIRRVHDLWQEMLNREFEMLESDLAYVAERIAIKRDELYKETKPRQPVLVSPFDPGPPEGKGSDY